MRYEHLYLDLSDITDEYFKKEDFAYSTEEVDVAEIISLFGGTTNWVVSYPSDGKPRLVESSFTLPYFEFQVEFKDNLDNLPGTDHRWTIEVDFNKIRIDIGRDDWVYISKDFICAWKQNRLEKTIQKNSK